MTDLLIVLWLILLTIEQGAWLAYYAFRYDWRSTPLGPVWLAKGGALAVTWVTFLLDSTIGVPDFVWAYIIGPLLVLTTGAWLVVTVRVRRSRKP